MKKTKWCCKNWCEKGFNLFTTTALTTVENKIPNVSNLANKADYNAKISEMEKKKFFTTSDYNKFTSNILDAKMSQKS